MYHINILTVIQKFSLFAQWAHFLYIVFLWKMTSHSDALFSICRTQAHFIQITLFKALKSATLLSLISIIDSWKALVTTSRSWISESHHHSLISRSLWIQQDHQRSISNHFFLHCFSNFLFNSENILESLNSKSDELSIRIWWYLHHHEWFSISSMIIITSDQCLLSRFTILLVAVIVMKLQVWHHLLLQWSWLKHQSTSSSYDFLWASLHVHNSWSRFLTFTIQIYLKFVKSNHTMIKIWLWLKKDEVEENEKLRKTEKAINKQQLYSFWSMLYHLNHIIYLKDKQCLCAIYTSSLLSSTSTTHHIYYL